MSTITPKKFRALAARVREEQVCPQNREPWNQRMYLRPDVKTGLAKCNRRGVSYGKLVDRMFDYCTVHGFDLVTNAPKPRR